MISSFKLASKASLLSGRDDSQVFPDISFHYRCAHSRVALRSFQLSSPLLCRTAFRRAHSAFHLLMIPPKLGELTSSDGRGGLSLEVSPAKAMPASNPARWASQEIALAVGISPRSIPP